MGGNHKHPRWEVFIGIGSGLRLIWQESDGSNKEELMNPENKQFLFIIPPNTPHAVLNNSTNESGILLEFASEKQKDVIQVKLI